MAAGALLMTVSLAQSQKSPGAADDGPHNTNLPADQAGRDQEKIEDAPSTAALLESRIQSQSGEKRKETADDYNAQSLEIQRRMADSAENQVSVGFAVFGIGLLDTVIAFYAFIYLRRTFGETQRAAKASRDAAEAAQAQVEIANKAFIRSHRPHLNVRNFRLERIGKDKIIVHYRIANIGDSEATIVSWNESYILALEEVFPAVPLYSPSRSLSGVGPLEIGTALLGAMPIIQENIGDTVFAASELGESFLYVYGFIHYTDKLKNLRELHFCRVFNPKSERFEIGDHEQEYAD
ncbi:MAG: hypothetical protein M3N91_14985 [Pseudomonadota bacterium]|nr:hypothetical protein [Pseudomonadota bacterium]